MLLNDAQQEAVNYTQGPCLVLAGAGSGKTRVITAKIIKLIKDNGFLSENICALTFTNKAAEEMKERVRSELGRELSCGLSISTFHSLGLEILKKEYVAAGLTKNFSLFDERDSEKVIRDIIKDDYPALLEIKSEKKAVQDVFSVICNWKSALLSADSVTDEGFNKDIYKIYSNYLTACNAVDFEDLIFKTALLFRENEQIRNKYAERFQYVLVDEYQDTNETQYQLLKFLTSRNQNFTVVGDDDQSIYSWRGARPENLKILSQDFPDLKLIKLEKNYRSTQHILNCANSLISHNQHIFSKKLYTDNASSIKVTVFETKDEEAEAEMVSALAIGYYMENQPCKWNDIAVLYRSNSQSKLYEKKFAEHGVPCFVNGGTSFFNQSEIKDFLCWYRLICNPYDDVALLRVINIPRRGIGHNTIKVLFDNAKQLDISIYECALNQNVTKQLIPRQKQAVLDFVLLITKLRQMLVSEKDLELVSTLPDLLNYSTYLSTIMSKDAVKYRMANVKELSDMMSDCINGKYSDEKLSFIEAVDKIGIREMLTKNQDSEENDAVQLMTLHASKGLEFPKVFLVGMEEGSLPHKNSIPSQENHFADNISEERRLAYVGITRARQDLSLLYVKQRIRAGIVSGVEKSRFLKELPDASIMFFKEGETPKLSREQKINFFEQAVKELGG